jgi:bacterioferritin
MKGDSDVIELLNAVLTSELTAINQYFIHYKMCADWGYGEIAEKKRSESIEEMKHADAVIERVLFLDGVPNMQRLNSVRVGENVKEMHELDLALEIEARTRLVDGIALCRDRKDEGTRALLQHILEQEEEGIDWLETQLHVIGEIGVERYLAEKL